MERGNWFFRLASILLIMLFVFLTLYGIYIMIALLFLNAKIVFERERRNLANSLSLIAAFALLAFAMTSTIMHTSNTPGIVRHIWGGISCLAFFYLAHAGVFLTNLALCCITSPKKNKDYIIVLGCGLIKGKVSKLLSNRVGKAMDFGLKQSKKTGKIPILIMSGGQGPNESVSEAEAMKACAIENGYDSDSILVENKSRNTLENMRFSKSIMDGRACGKKYSCIFCTSSFHLLRSAIYARKAGMKISGIGAKTAWYYLPNAIMRENIAFIFMHKKLFIAAAMALFAFGTAFPSIPLFFSELFFATGMPL
jgi:uncharacterized SAM-binding protein YcdF (DUF218 family)